MKILAIGATGFIGSRVARQLLMQGHQVVLFHRGNTTASELDSIVHLYGTRNELPNFKAEFERFAPDVVLDIIPYTKTQAQDVVQVFSGCTQRIVAISSGDIYRNYEGFHGQGNHPPDPVPLTEDAPLRETRYPYRNLKELEFEFKQDYDKILVEQVLMNHQGYVENVAAAIALAVTDNRAEGLIYNFGEPATPTLLKRIQQIGNVAGWSGEIVMLAKEQLPPHLQMNFQLS